MELELGLAPAAHFVDRKCFDLNEDVFEKNEVMMKKRSSDEAFDRNGTGRKTLALLQWSRQPNDDEDDQNAADRLRKCQVHQGNVEEKGILVGWPPIRSWRKRLLHDHEGGGWVVVTNERIINGGRNSTFVKVKMEGVAIGRKIDLSLYNSYQVLTNDLINMFARYQECGQNGGGYALLYQDKQGNWLVAGDVPWMTFVGSVHRIELLRRGN